MRRRSVLLAVAVLAAGLLVASLAGAAGGKKNLKADELTGYQENPDISTAATGRSSHDRRRRADDHLRAQLLRDRGRSSSLAHPLRQAGRQRGRLGVPVRRRRQARVPGAPDGTVTGVIDAADILGPAVRASRLAPSTSSWPRCAPGTRTRTSTAPARSGRAARSARRSTTATPTTSASGRPRDREPGSGRALVISAGLCSRPMTSSRKALARAPSTTRWSNVQASQPISRTTTSPSTTAGRGPIRCRPRMPTSGWLTSGVAKSPPSLPGARHRERRALELLRA